MGYDVDLTLKTECELTKWQKEEFYPAMNDLWKKWRNKLQEIGIPEKDTTPYLISHFIAYGLHLQMQNYPVDKTTAMMDCSEIYDTVVDAIKPLSEHTTRQ